MENTTNNVSAKVEVNNGSERSNKKPGKEEKSKRKDDKSIDQVMKALNNLETTDEKLAAMCKKYAEVLDDNRKLQLSAKQFEKGLNAVQREKEQLQTDHSKAVLTRSRLESLCRELQRQNKAVKEESVLKVREEEEKRKEVSAKFNATLSEITTLMSSSNEKTNKLRDENVDITLKFRSICEQSGLQQQQVDKMNMQRKLEGELNEAKMTKQKLEFTAEKEIMLRDKQQLLMDLQESRTRITDMMTNEATLRSQIALYSDRYEEFQNALSRSNEVFGGFKGEMDKMSKKIVKLEKETLSWKTRWEKSHQALLEMATDKQQRDGELALVQRQLAQLQKLCRTLQTERTGLLAKIRGSDQATAGGDPDKLADLVQASGIEDMSDLAGLLNTPVVAKLPDISDIFKDPTKDHISKAIAGETKGHKGGSSKSNKKAKGSAAMNSVKESTKEVESALNAEVKAAKNDSSDKVDNRTPEAVKPTDVAVATEPFKTVDTLPLKLDELQVAPEMTVADVTTPKISSPQSNKKFKSAAVADAVTEPVNEGKQSVANAAPVETFEFSTEPNKEVESLSLKDVEGKKEVAITVPETKATKIGNQKVHKKAKPSTDSKPKEDMKAGKVVATVKTVGSEEKGGVDKAEPINDSVGSKVNEVSAVPASEKVIPALSQLASKEVLLAKIDVNVPLLDAIPVEAPKPSASDINPVVKPVESVLATGTASMSSPAKANEKVPQLVKEKAEVLPKPNKKTPATIKEKHQPNLSGASAKPLKDVPNDKMSVEVIDLPAKQIDTSSVSSNKAAPQVTEAAAVLMETGATAASQKVAPQDIKALAKPKETCTITNEKLFSQVVGALAKPTEIATNTSNETVLPQVVEMLAKPADISTATTVKVTPQGVEATAKPTETTPTLPNEKALPQLIEIIAEPSVTTVPLTTEPPQPADLSAKNSPASSTPTAIPAKVSSADMKKGKEGAKKRKK